MSHRLDDAFERALAYLDQHLNEPFDRQVLADIAHIPLCHFDPLFTALYHMSIDAYVELLKSLEAAHLLGFGKQVSLATIAAKLAYRNEQHFIESFTRSIGQSPESFQQAPDWGNFFAKQQPLKSFRVDANQQDKQSYSVDIVSFDAQALAVMEHHGDPALLPQTIARFIEWRRQFGLFPTSCRTFNLLYSTLELSVKTQYRIDIGVSLNAETQAIVSESSQIKLKSIPQGRCAMIKYSGDDNGLTAAIDYLYRDWVNANDITLRNYPVYLERLDIGRTASVEQQSGSPLDAQQVLICLPIV
ncbi:AraC family transcriptional regulator [Shewanella sp. BF02_Schw]|uniref:AraC family transcriptional regulator n=1 Tax=Shewanella sp. BF02_Schw TaxID=394908 RepID=UPI0017811E18|nr:GyrI-like domain-containing protein [Shewanella sp. BF02_Schw]MBO1896833.1 AraC family transcriptional regulator [Shewanella sp. BF02_Schw]